MPDILSNNIRQRGSETAIPKKVEPVIKLVEKKETGFASKLVHTFVNVDPKTVSKNIWDQILVPTIKRTFITSVTSGLSQMFNINVTPQIVDSVFGTQVQGARIGYTGYSAMSTMGSTMQPINQPQAVAPRPVAGIDRYMTFTYASEADANTVIETMSDMADRYDRAIAVGYLCQTVGQPDTATDYSFGWTREMIARAKPVLNIDGTWLISWPRPIAIAQ